MADKTAAITKEIILKRSKIKVVYTEDFETADVIAAQKAAGKDAGMFSLYLAQRIATFDGAKLTMGDIKDRIKGRDYLQLTGALLADDEAEGEPGNA